MFCGAGGLTHAMKKNNFEIICGIDIDKQCRYAYETNNQTQFFCKDIREITKNWLNNICWPSPRILVGCAPCQPFSLLKNKPQLDNQWSLFRNFLKIAEIVKPDIISMENVKGFAQFNNGVLISETILKLESLGYHVWFDTVNAADFGAPQRRNRFVLLASRHKKISLLPSLKKNKAVTVRDTIGHLPSIKAGEICNSDFMHRACNLSEINLKRIQRSIPGKNYNIWPDDLLLPCQKRAVKNPFRSPYGRMEWDKPSPTITTQYFGYSRGRFGHPKQDRALSLREGALLQGFPENYQFATHENISYVAVGKMVGNAVPFQLGEAIAQSISYHMQ